MGDFNCEPKHLPTLQKELAEGRFTDVGATEGDWKGRRGSVTSRRDGQSPVLVQVTQVGGSLAGNRCASTGWAPVRVTPHRPSGWKLQRSACQAVIARP